MNAKQERNEAEAGAEPRPETVHASRRRFTRAGLSASVVLGSLASKPVLGAAPYHCTVSGQISGNMSPRPGSAQTCVTGQSRSTWLTTMVWPSPIKRGSLPDVTCAFAASDEATRFNGFAASGNSLTPTFYNKVVNSACMVQLDDTTVPSSTMLQVLNTDPGTQSDPRFNLARAVVVSLLNSYESAPNYPVTAATIVAMFNATVNGVGKYQVNATVQWDRAQVTGYLQSLYPPG
jgi:hypothetical protein